MTDNDVPPPPPLAKEGNSTGITGNVARRRVGTSSPVSDRGTDGIDFRRRDRNPRQQQQHQQRVLKQVGEASQGREDER